MKNNQNNESFQEYYMQKLAEKAYQTPVERVSEKVDQGELNPFQEDFDLNGTERIIYRAAVLQTALKSIFFI